MHSGPDEWRSFLAVARDLHFCKASQRLFISQPALSKQIQKLEEKIGAPLFVRTRHKVVLSEIGRALVPVAQKLLQDSRDAFSLAKDMVEGRAGMLRIGFGTSAMSRLLPKMVQRFRKTHKTVNVRLLQTAVTCSLVVKRRTHRYRAIANSRQLCISRFGFFRSGGFSIFLEFYLLADQSPQ